MSKVTDILLCTAIDDGSRGDGEHPNADLLTAWLVEQYGPASTLNKLDHMAGGNKAMQCDVFGVAINCCNTKSLISKFRSIKWEWPERAQLLVREDGDGAFVVHSASDTD